MYTKLYHRNLLVIFILCFLNNGISAQNWTQKTNIPSGAGAFSNFSVNGKGYVIAPLSNVLTEYDPGTNTWTTKASFPGTVRESAVCFSIGNKGYIATGVRSDGSTFLNDLWEYNASTDVWTQKANLPGSARQNATGFSIGGKGYIGTGYNGNLLNDFWEYDVLTNTWTQKANFAGGVRAEATGFSIDDKGYITTGTSTLSNSGLLSDLWQFNPNTNSWTQKSSYPGSPRVVAVSFSIGRQAVVGTGSGDFNAGPGPYYHDFWRYDPALNTWTSLPDYPGDGSFLLIGFFNGTNAYVGAGEGGGLYSDFWQFSVAAACNAGTWAVKDGGSSLARRGGQAAAVVNGIAYVVGGAAPFSTSSVAANEAYDPLTNSWTTKAAMPFASQQLVAQSINGIVYAVAGGSCCGAYNYVQAYDPVSNSWSLKTPAPTARYGATSAVVNNKMYVMSGSSGYGDSYQNLEEYDPVTNTWATKTPMPFYRGGCVAAVVNGIIYAIGGGDASGIFYGTVQAYDPASGAWSIKTPMPTPRGGLSVAVLNNKIYAIGGHPNGSEFTNLVEVYDPATDSWCTGSSLTTIVGTMSSTVAINGKIYSIGNIQPAYPASQMLTVEEFMQCVSSSSNSTVVACDHYLWNGVDYTTSGDKTFTTTNAAGCDSVATLHLTIKHSSTSSTSVTACDHYVWNGVDYTSSGDKVYTTTNAESCDSVATLHLTVRHSSTSSSSVTACDQYLWNGVLYTTSGDKVFTTTNAEGCDSVATLHLTINHSSSSSTTVTACDQYLWNGTVYTTSGDKTYSTTNAAGCDSVATLHLTIINGPTAPVISCPSGNPFTRNANSSCKYIIAGAEFNASASAQCGTPTLSYQLTGATTGSGTSSLSGLQLNIGTTTVSWTATNGSSTSTCSITVNIVDNQSPVITTCPSNISTTLKGKNCNTKIKVTGTASCSDNCGVTSLTWLMTGATSGSSPSTGINSGVGTQTFNAGITTITYTARDAAGNFATCSFTVTVTNPNCPNSAFTRSKRDHSTELESIQGNDFEIKINPNPSADQFILTVMSGKEQKVEIVIMDVLGRMLEKTNVLPNQQYKFGDKLINGIYLIEVKQGTQRKVTRIIKQ